MSSFHVHIYIYILPVRIILGEREGGDDSYYFPVFLYH